MRVKIGVSLWNVCKHMPWLSLDFSLWWVELLHTWSTNLNPFSLAGLTETCCKSQSGPSSSTVQAFKPGFLGQLQIRYYSAGRKDRQDWSLCKSGNSLTQEQAFLLQEMLVPVSINYHFWVSGTGKTYWADRKPSVKEQRDTGCHLLSLRLKWKMSKDSWSSKTSSPKKPYEDVGFLKSKDM